MHAEHSDHRTQHLRGGEKEYSVELTSDGGEWSSQYEKREYLARVRIKRQGCGTLLFELILRKRRRGVCAYMYIYIHKC